MGMSLEKCLSALFASLCAEGWRHKCLLGDAYSSVCNLGIIDSATTESISQPVRLLLSYPLCEHYLLVVD